MALTYVVNIEVRETQFGFEAVALLWDPKSHSESRASISTGGMASRDRNRAVSYALTELAAKISGGR